MTALSRKADNIDLFPALIARAQAEREQAAADASRCERIAAESRQQAEGRILRLVLDTLGFCAAMAALLVVWVIAAAITV